MHPESEAALGHIRKAVSPAKRIIFVSGNFNILHPGHLRLLKFAADCGDYLVVGVNSGVNNGVVVPEHLRLENIQAIGLVNFAFLLRERPEEFIAKLRPAVVVKGKEHEGRFNPESKVVETYGGHLLFSSGEVVFSSLDLMRREFSEFNLSTIVKPQDFPDRHGFSFHNIRTVLRKFQGLRVMVVGDLIVDEYIACDALGMSQEDPTIVVTPVLQKKFVGGAGIVAAHAKGLGAEVKFISVTGKDAISQFALKQLHEYRVDTCFLEDESRPTTLKQRYRASNKTLLRVSHLKQHDIDLEIQEQILSQVKASISRTDLLIFSDFNYGCLPQPLVNSIVECCNGHGVPMVADSQSSSQVGDISRYKGMRLITPTEREARLAMRDFNSGLVVLAELLRKHSAARNVILTLDSEGLLIHAACGDKKLWTTDRLPALNMAPKDSAGAGDSFLTCASLALVVGADIWQSAYLGSLAAACQVARIGNTPLSSTDIEAEIDV